MAPAEDKDQLPDSKEKNILDVTDCKEQFSQIQDKVKPHLIQLEKLRQEGAHNNDGRVRTVLEQLRQLLKVSKKQWFEITDNDSLDLMIEKLQSDLKHLDQFVQSCSTATVAELLGSASDGVALKGILLNRTNCTQQTKRTVLSTLNDVGLVSLCMQPVDGEASFSSKDQLELFLSSNVKGDWGSAKNIRQGKGKQSEPCFQAHVMYNVVPTAACQLNQSNLSLSSEALKELQLIDKILTSDSTEKVESKCQTFLKIYGSHINAGVLHLGGINNFVATYEKSDLVEDRTIKTGLDQKKEEVAEQKTVQVTASNEQCEAKHESDQENGIGTEQDKDVKPNSEQEDLKKAECDKKRETKEMAEQTNQAESIPQQQCDTRQESQQESEVQAESEQTCDTKNQNKELGSEKETRIDQNLQETDTESRIADFLHDALKGYVSLNCTGLGPSVRESVPASHGDLQTWLSGGHQKSGGNNIELRTIRKGGPPEVNSLPFWKLGLASCSNTWVLIESALSASESSTLVGIWELIANHKGEFTEPDALANALEKAWSCFSKYRPILEKAKVRNVSGLVALLNDRFVPLVSGDLERSQEDRLFFGDFHADVTADVVLCLHHLLECLRSSGEMHEFFFLKTALLPLQYEESSMRFKEGLNMERLKEFAKYLKTEWAAYRSHKELGSVQLDSFLIHLSLDSGQFQKEQQKSEDAFSDMVRELRPVLRPEVNQLLNRYATPPFNWDELYEKTGELAKGNMSAAEEREVDLAYLTDVCTNEIIQFHDCAERTADLKPCAQYTDILKALALTEYFPSKMSFLDAVTIGKEKTEMSLSDLPWQVVEKLMMIDFHAFDLVAVANQSCQATASVSASEEFDLEDLLGDVHITQRKETESGSLSTLDVLVTIFGCCDNFLKQFLAQKLFACKLAIPFIYPVGSQSTLYMSLWALRMIVIECTDKTKATMETSVTDRPIPIVTFLRLGRPPLSKSKLMNDVLSDEVHNTFFHYDCNNGTVHRTVSNGLVECSWLLPTGKKRERGHEVEILPVTTMFLNLRGDASSHEKQLDVLTKISSVLLIVASAGDLANNPHTVTYRKIFKASSNIILLLMSGSRDQTQQQLNAERQAFREAVGKENLRGIQLISSSSKQGVPKNASQLKTDVRSKLSEILTTCDGITTEESAVLADKEGIIIDEHLSTCLKGRRHAEEVITYIKGRDIVECKRELLPLQGEEWMQYSKLLKEQHRTSGKSVHTTAEHQAKQLKIKMVKHRREQVQICSSERMFFVKSVIKVLRTSADNGDMAKYFLHWLKLFLDKMSRRNLPTLREKYHSLWLQLQEVKKEQNQTEMERLRVKVNQSEQQLAMASFGLENIFRELGQMYECLSEGTKKSKDTRKILESLSQIGAEQLLRGNPLEVVDGDAASVPIVWIRSVLSKLQDNIGDKRVLVLSVLGVQSSGKSTLLNTMFGLQFAVSAGRCTRGAYMQLIPVDESAGLSYDYLAVIDTEGLRAAELGQLKHSHDNELATLVIGLGDVTLMNIKGENTSEIRDVLQIAVHAFLRMNAVRNNIRNYRTCVFVHQNVPAVDADKMMMHGCQKLQECLDEMAQESAHIENIENIHSFSQIINFDVRKHVWYFADLWHGNPPMAPANPGYSEKVRAVKLSLLRDTAAEQTTFLTISDLSLRIRDLWNGVLADDFVFSFRNSLEVKAYNSLESTYYRLEWDLHNSLLTWLQDTAAIKIRKCESTEALAACSYELHADLPRKIFSKLSEIQSVLEEYFKKSNLREVMIQWQQTKINALRTAAEERHNELKAELLAIKEARQIELMNTKKWLKHEAEILEEAIRLADKMKGEELPEKKLKKRFDDMWVPMVHELASRETRNDNRVDFLMEKILYERYQSHWDILRQELEDNPLCRSLVHDSLEDSISLDDIKADHLSVKTTFTGKLVEKAKAVWDTITSSFKSPDEHGESNLEAARQNTLHFTRAVLQHSNAYLNDLCRQDVKFQRSHAVAVIQNLREKTETFNATARVSGGCSFKVLPVYEVKLAVHIARHCVQVFTMMQHEYKKRHGIEAKLEEYKETAWGFFKNMVNQSTEEVIAGDLFCSLVKGTIEEAVNKGLLRKFVDEVMRDLQMTKHTLIVKIMDDLARNGIFKEYESYIYDAKSFALKWLTKYTDDKMFKQTDNSTSRYQDLTSCHVSSIKTCIVESVKYATKKVQGEKEDRMHFWITEFCSHVTHVAVSGISLTQMNTRQVTDFGNLQRIILDKLKDVEDSLVTAFAQHTASSIKWGDTTPYQQVLDKLWGCPEQCFFCKEPCQDTTADHYKKSGGRRSHNCVQHRPVGIGGWRYLFSRKLDTDTCGFLVQSDKSMSCGVCAEWHPCIDYNKCYKGWNIGPDPTNSTSKYWTWFMATYQHQLKEMHQAELPDIDPSWKMVTKQEALDDLNQVHS